jgi:hypothetical protein
MATQRHGQLGSTNTSLVRQTISTDEDYTIGVLDDLVIAERPCTLRLPKDAYVGKVIQCTADVSCKDGTVHVHGTDCKPIAGGNIHLKKGSSVTLTLAPSRTWIAG